MATDDALPKPCSAAGNICVDQKQVDEPASALPQPSGFGNPEGESPTPTQDHTESRSAERETVDTLVIQFISDLAEKCNQGELTPHERREYEGYVRAIDFISIMQAKARKALLKPRKAS